MLKAIETHYKGYRFRSRLEARWAVFFDAIGVKWVYEKEGFDLGESGLYLPDFWLPAVYDRGGRRGVWAEIKGQEPTTEESAKCESLAQSSGYSVNLFVGLPGEYGEGGYQFTVWPPDRPYISWDHNMVFHRCSVCRAVKIEFSNDYYDCFGCGRGTCTQFNTDIDLAFARAKSARFEHGENPR